MKTAVREYTLSHSDSKDTLDNWFKVVSQANWSNLLDVKSVFPSA
ncbi:type II toxin-antitoxin system HigB family toxin [Okeania sp.]|nr:type II toxin-antitoxin system HigB family toxin [Okeania sp.]